jgi:acetylglutamate kinase
MGIKRTHIINGTIPHPIMLEIFTDTGIGTMITE